MHDFLVQLSQGLVVAGFGTYAFYRIARLALWFSKRHPPPPDPPTALERIIERDWAEAGVYDPSRPTDWDELERTIERTLATRKQHHHVFASGGKANAPIPCFEDVVPVSRRVHPGTHDRSL